MTMTHPAGSATIYDFPIGGRRVSARRFEQPATVSDLRPTLVLAVDYGNWYHEEAMRDSETAPKS